MSARRQLVPHFETASRRWCWQMARYVIRARKARGWSQAELGTRLGLSQSAVAALERNPTGAHADRLFAALRALDMEIVVRTSVQPRPEDQAA
jgi:transcriptional regulator with XRE-family HTH domain